MHPTRLGGPRLLRTVALGLFAAAILALIVTYLGVRTKATVEAQVPYLASGGLLCVVCAAFGTGALIISSGAEEDLRSVRHKLDDLADFVAIETELLHTEIGTLTRPTESARR